MDAQLLCVGDLHLGRRPSRLPPDLDDLGVDPRTLTPAAAWRAIIDYACHAKVAAVLLAGDVVESAGDFYESYELLDQGVRQLLAAGIPVMAVAGNHDVGVLPRLDDAIADFHLLGRDGHWQAPVPVTHEGTVVARVLGWSFGSPRVEHNPLAALPRQDAGPPLIGLLHCDVDVHTSPYAPVRRFQLEAAPVDAWMLGHIHKPDPLATMTRPIGYLGSVVGLDPTESGPHGPWQLELGAGRLRAHQVPLAPLRWETQVLDLTDLRDPLELPVRLGAAVLALHTRLVQSPHRPRCVGVRVALTGRNGLGQALHRLLADRDLALTAFRKRHDGIAYFVESVTLEALQPAIDLADLARDHDPPGIVARTLLVLDQPPDDPARHQLLTDARRALALEVANPVWQPLGAYALTDDAVAHWLRTAALRTLDGLLGQRQGPG
jgi:DNA repair protein SbcD/Mre11